MNFKTSGNLEDVFFNAYAPFEETVNENILKWKYNENKMDSRNRRATLIEASEESTNEMIVSLKPMQIRTFVIEIKKSDI